MDSFQEWNGETLSRDRRRRMGRVEDLRYLVLENTQKEAVRAQEEGVISTDEQSASDYELELFDIAIEPLLPNDITDEYESRIRLSELRDKPKEKEKVKRANREQPKTNTHIPRPRKLHRMKSEGSVLKKQASNHLSDVTMQFKYSNAMEHKEITVATQKGKNVTSKPIWVAESREKRKISLSPVIGRSESCPPLKSVIRTTPSNSNLLAVPKRSSEKRRVRFSLPAIGLKEDKNTIAPSKYQVLPEIRCKEEK
ncbi:unnamed protein product [Dimorphilus gyrociliatus]|uniref:Uncharacterized protein n=1 Tax=Dimorphilus gyrociliatus TaxID=2664684 RepID=A0A7I8W681_9ANNE|nr:unnamed protein product [Dimorphilus gyrociliatus]